MLTTQDRQVGMLDAAELCDAAVEEGSFYALPGVAKLLAAVSAEDEEATSELSASLEFQLSPPGQKPDCDWRSGLLPDQP